MECSACIPRERVLSVCKWAYARIAERNAATLQDEVARMNWLRLRLHMRPLGDAEVHERLLRTSCSYPGRCWREREISELLTLARDADGGVRVRGRDWRGLLQWCADNGWQDEGRPPGPGE